MHLRNFLLLGLITLFIGSGSAFAVTTGVIAGKVTDVDGNPIPGVTVTVVGENLPGDRVDTSSATGTYRMPQLTPGDYTVTAELMGMKTIKREGIRVSIDSTTRVDFTMEMAVLEETIVVSGANPVLDVKSTTVKTTISRDVTERLPGSDDMQSAFTMSGGITGGGGGNPQVHGASQTDNLFLFDGVDTTDPITSTFGANLSADAMEEVEVQTGGFQAEYGRAMGGIVNAVMKSGGNEFHGIIRVKYVNTDWEAEDEHPTESTDAEYYAPTLTLEGPILKDKLWFMVSYSYSNNDGTTNALASYGGDIDNESDLVAVKTDAVFNLPYAKLTFQANQEHKFVFNYSGEDDDIYNRGARLSQSWTADTFFKQDQGGPFFSLEWTWLYNPNLFFITRAGASYGILDTVPENKSSDPRDAPFYDYYERVNYNNTTSWSEEDRNKEQLSFIANYFIEDLMGSHDWKSGIEYHSNTTEEFKDFAGGGKYNITQIPIGDPDNPDYYVGTNAYRIVYVNPGTAEASGDYYSFFIQDNWSITENVTLNLGLRYEYNIFENDDGETDVPSWTWGNFRAEDYRNPDLSIKNTAPMKFDDMIAPRVGISWDILGNQKSVLRAYYGRFFNPFNLQITSMMFQPFSADHYADYYQDYEGPQWSDMNKDGIPDEDFFFDDANWGPRYNEDKEQFPNLIDPDMEAEYTDEIVLGFDQEVMDNFSVGLTYTYRETNDMIEDVGLFLDDDGNVKWTYLGGIKDDYSGVDPNLKFDPVDGTYQHIYWITNADGSRRKYVGYEINARARRKHWDLQASYTYAQAQGAVTESQPGSATGVSQFSVYFDTFQASQNLFGDLPWSIDHYVKLAGSWHYDFTDWYEFSLGIDGFWRSGYHYSKRTNPFATYDPDDPSNDINNRETWTGRPPYADSALYLPDGRGTEELPSFWTVDVSLQNTFRFGKWGNLTAIFDIFNALDNQSILSESNNFNPNYPERFGQENGWASPRYYRLSLKYAF